MRLIDADKAFEVLTEVYHHKTEAQRMALKEALDRVPTIEAEPVRWGRWEIAGREDPCIYYCSECHHMTDLEWPYCAECGARMEADHEID